MPKKRKRQRRPFRGHHPAGGGARASDRRFGAPPDAQPSEPGTAPPVSGAPMSGSTEAPFITGEPPLVPGEPPPDEPDLIAEVRQMLGEDHPWALLGLVSSIVAAADTPTHVFPGMDDERERIDLGALVTSFSEVRIVETTALLATFAEILPDELLTRRLRREVDGRNDPLPDWLGRLSPLDITGTMEVVDVLGDGDNHLIAARTASGHDLTAVVYIDHNLGTVVKDAFVVPASLEEVAADLAEASGHDPDLRASHLDPAATRTRVNDATEQWARTYPPLETDTWPACRPLVDWLVRHLPEGGAGYERPEWSDADREELTDRFFASSHARGHDAEDRQLFDTLVWFGCDYGPGDPLRWSPVSVEIFLTDWLPRKVVADVDFLTRAPALLRSLIRFGHAELGIRPVRTEETLAAVDTWEPAYQETIRSSRPQGPAALLAAMVGHLDEESLADDWFDGLLGDGHIIDYGQAIVEWIERRVGGPEALQQLDDTPLPDEPFDWSAVPGDVRDRVAETLELVDSSCGALLDVECRTAARRLLATVVAGDADVFRRRGRTDTAAAALVWTIAKANDRLSSGELTAKALLAWFGLTGSVSQRAGRLLKAAGIEGADAYDMALGSPRYLTSTHRRALLETRSYYLDR